MFERAAILGLGLMGASLGLALRERGLAREVAGYDASADVGERALARGAVSRLGGRAAEAVASSELVVLATPVLAMHGLLAEIGPHLAPGAVVSDLGSTKRAVVGWAEAALPAPGRFVGGHPMAGGERSGPDAAEAALFEGCVWCITPSASTAPEALARVTALVAALGARPHVLDANRHDAAVAAISHLPLVSAATLTLTAAESAAWPDAAPLAAGGFHDTTRVASGDPRMARDICLTNAGALLPLLDAYIARLQQLRGAIAAGEPEAIEGEFSAAKAARDGWLRG